MRFYLMLCSFLLPLCMYGQGPDGIEYGETEKFHWGMFRGRINPKHIAEMGRNTGAVTVSSLSYNTVKFTNTSVILKVSAKFHEDESWTRYPKLRNPGHALNHEKRHFDLCEVYARKIRQLLTETKFTRRSLNSQLKAIFAQMTQEHSDEQSRYDHETEHSLDPQEQLAWNKMIDNRLAELEDYAETTVVIPLN